MQHITGEDIHKINELISVGYQNAADSLSDVVGQKVEVTDIEITAYDHFRLIDEKENGHTVILTELIGDLIGESYLMLNEKERKVITDYCREAFGRASDLSEEAILKEIDNIISAAMITEFSNELKSKVFGDVPKVLNNGDFEEHVNNSSDQHLLLSQARFKFTDHLDVSPKFIWRLNQGFLVQTEDKSTSA